MRLSDEDRAAMEAVAPGYSRIFESLLQSGSPPTQPKPKPRTDPIWCIYRNLRHSTQTKTVWSLVPSSVDRNGYARKGKGPELFDHEAPRIMTDVITNNPQSIATGCAGIRRNRANPNTKAGRYVVAWVAGTVKALDPGSAMQPGTFQGVLDLDVESGAFVVRGPNGTVPFNPEGATLIFREGCEGYR